MGNWENTTYLEHDDTRGLAAAIVELLQEEGMERIAKPPPRQPERFDPMQYADALESNLWGIAVFPAAPGWSVIKTAPLELLAERAPGASRMRLVELGTRLGAGGCQVNLYDGTSMVLVEMDQRGRCLLSGYCLRSDNPDPMRFHGEQIGEDRADVRFELLPLQQLVEASLGDSGSGPWCDHDALVARLAHSLGGDNAAACDNLTSVEFLVGHLPLVMRGGIDLCFAWPPGDRRAPLLEKLRG